MSDYQQPEQPNNESSSGNDTDRSELIGELQALGKQLESTFRTFMAGPGQKIRREIGEGLQELGSQVQRAVGTIQQRPEAEKIEQKARDVAAQVKESSVVRDVEDTLVSGLQQLNQQLKRLVERLEQPGDSAKAEQGPSTQRLDIEDESNNPPSDQPPII